MISGGSRQSCNTLRAILVAHWRPEDIDKLLIRTETQRCTVPCVVTLTHLESSFTPNSPLCHIIYKGIKTGKQ